MGAAMAEYILTPEKKNQPPALELMEELHRRGFPVEINLKGRDPKWDAIRFFQPGPPEIECFLSFDADNGSYSVAVSQDAPPSAADLQIFLVDALLQNLGGQVDNVNTRERFTPEEFGARLKRHHNPSERMKEWFWVAFSWAVSVLALGIYFVVAPHLRQLVALILVLSSLSALLQTYSHLKN